MHEEKYEIQDKEHWADALADKIIEVKGELEEYTVAAGITPSGVVHIGNFREIITVDLIAKALERKGKKVRFIYSWDDYDVFRKVPANFPEKEMLEKYLRQPIVDVPDPFKCHKSFAEHNEKAVEDKLSVMGVFPKFIYQSKKYRASDYAEGMKTAMQNKAKIKEILDEWRKDPLSSDWVPIRVFCSKCNIDETKVTAYDGEYNVTYLCECGHEEKIDFRKTGLAKLQWRVDWPMRWNYEKVRFEPSGKEHSSDGGSNTTAERIVKEIYGFEAPFHIMYEFISIKGSGGKMSSSKGNTIDLTEMLSIYEPALIRFLFVRTMPSKSFEISFDGDVLTIYDEFDRLERIYFGEEETRTESALEQQKRIYELSCIEIPEKMPYQPGFRHIATVLQSNIFDEEKTVEYFKNELKTDFDKKRLKERILCAKNWIEKYAPEQFLFKIQESVTVDAEKIPKEIKLALKKYAQVITDSMSEEQLGEKFKEISASTKISLKELFSAAYVLLLNKERGPKLFQLIKSAGVSKFKYLAENLSSKEIKSKKQEINLPGKDKLEEKFDFEISEDLKKNFPNLRMGLIIIDTLDNQEVSDEIVSLLRSQEKETKKALEGKELSSVENLKLWREAYSSFGGKPKKNKPSVEALVKRVVKGDELPNINSLVNLYNYISIKYLLPVGGDDISKVEGKITLGYAKGNENFLMIGASEAESPKEGEVIYKDSKDVLCRRWNWRECEKTKLTSKTKTAVIYLESLNLEDDLGKAVEELANLIEKYCKAKTSVFVI